MIWTVLARTVLGIIVVGMCFLPAATLAQERIELGPMRVTEGGGGPAERNRWSATANLSFSARYDDNYFRTEDFENSVYTYVVSPGIQLDYESAKSIISLFYSLNIPEYRDQDDGPEGSADEQDFIGHALNLNIQTSPTPKLTFRIQDSLNVTREPDKSDRVANSTERERFFVNRIYPSVNYRFNDRFSTALSYAGTILDYRTDTDQDSVGHSGQWQGFYHLSPTSSINLSYQYSQRDYDVSVSDYKSNNVGVGFNTGGKYITLETAVGYQRRDFSAADRPDEDVLNYRLALVGQSASGRSNIRFAFGQNFNESGIQDDFFEALQFEVSAGHTLRDRLRLQIAAAYLNADYPQQTASLEDGRLVDREDDRYRFSGSIAYSFLEWLGVSLSGGYETRDSNLPGFDYDNTFVQLTLNTSYDITR